MPISSETPRVISMVPSWTETLLHAGVNVVGRTGYCVHPKDRVRDIPVVGGTKNLQLKKAHRLSADYIVLDKEENTLDMYEKSPCPVLATHVTGPESVAADLMILAGRLGGGLNEIASRWQALDKLTVPQKRAVDFTVGRLPGLIEWLRQPEQPVERFVYVIWRNPWMAVSPQTFIGGVWKKLGYGSWHWGTDVRYPEFDLGVFDPSTTLLLFASEPYPFVKKRAGLAGLGFPAALVDGEMFSWFGVRALHFLESQLLDEAPFSAQ